MIEICVVNGGIPFRLGDVAPIQSLRGRRHILKGRLCFGRLYIGTPAADAPSDCILHNIHHISRCGRSEQRRRRKKRRRRCRRAKMRWRYRADVRGKEKIGE